MLAERDGTWLSWRSAGDGPPLVLVMGLGGPGAAWWRLETLLAPHVRVITLDNRGTGRSDRIGPGGITMAGLVGDVLAVMDAAGVREAHLLGTSLGGMIAQQLALDHPGRVASLVLASSTPTAFRGGPPWRLFAANAVLPLLGERRAWPLLAEVLYARSTPRERPELIDEDIALRAVEPTPAWTPIAQLAAVARHDTRPRLHELARIPVTVAHGEQDAVIAVARARELAAGIPGARLEVVADGGHMLTTDAGGWVADVVLEHLARAGERAA